MGESALHIASRTGMADLVTRLLEAGCNPALQTPPPSAQTGLNVSPKKNGPNSHHNDDSNPFGDDEDDVIPQDHKLDQMGNGLVIGLQSPLHLAVLGGHDDVVQAFVQHAE